MRESITEEVTWHKGLPWPETTHSVLVNLNPMDAAAIFADVESHEKFIPQIMRSRISKHISPNEIHVSYKIKVPFPVISTTYTTANIFETLEDGTFLTRWYMIEAEESKDIQGFASFTPYEGRTLMRYNNLVVPKSGLAGMFASKYTKDTATTVELIAQHLNSWQGKVCGTLDRRRQSFMDRLDAAS